MADFVMPSLGADMEEGTVIRWLVKPGDEVRRGQIVAEVETEKADMEIEIFQDGVIDELIANEGDTVPVGGLLARVQAAGEARAVPEQEPPAEAPTAAEEATPEEAPQPADEGEPAAAKAETPGDGATPTEREPAPKPAVEATPAPPAKPQEAAERRRVTPSARKLAAELGVDPDTVRGTGVDGAVRRADIEQAATRGPAVAAPTEGRARVSPYARKKASELGVDLGQVTGSGPGGAITADDVQRAAAVPGAKAKPGPAPADKPAEPQEPPAEPETDRAAARTAARQRVIANLMERSKREIPHYYLGHTVDLSRAMQWLQEENQQRPVPERLLYSVLLMKAVAAAVPSVPEVNGNYEDGAFQPWTTVNLGVAVSLRDGGLVTPAVQDAGNKSLEELMRDLRDLVQRARTGKLRAAEMSNATITVTNLGDQGVESVQGVIYPPQVAIVGFGKVIERPWAEQGMVGVRPTITATLAADHRVSNGHRGGLFLAAIDRLLQEPTKL